MPPPALNACGWPKMNPGVRAVARPLQRMTPTMKVSTPMPVAAIDHTTMVATRSERTDFLCCASRATLLIFMASMTSASTLGGPSRVFFLLRERPHQHYHHHGEQQEHQRHGEQRGPGGPRRFLYLCLLYTSPSPRD